MEQASTHREILQGLLHPAPYVSTMTVPPVLVPIGLLRPPLPRWAVPTPRHTDEKADDVPPPGLQGDKDRYPRSTQPPPVHRAAPTHHQPANPPDPSPAPRRRARRPR